MAGFMNNKDKIRILEGYLSSIEELQVRLIVAFLFMMIFGSAFCIVMILYNYFIV